MANDYHQYIYDTVNRRIRGDFEAAYARCDDVWPTQHQLDLPHFVYVKGLLDDRARTLGRKVRVLDVGCGYGDLVDELNRFHPCDAIGVEISDSAVRKGRERFGSDLPVVVGDLGHGLPDTIGRPFDVVLVLGVLWFLLERIDSAVDELYRVATPAAEFVFSLHVPPNPIGKEIIGSYDDLLRLLRQRFEVVDGFRFYQPLELRKQQPLAATADDMLVRCRRPAER